MKPKLTREQRFPGWPKEAYRVMEDQHCIPLGKAKHDDAIRMRTAGATVAKICQTLNCSANALYLQIRFDPEFKRRWQGCEDFRGGLVTDILMERLINGQDIVTEIWKPVMVTSKAGNKIHDLDHHGKPRMYLAERRVTKQGPSDTLLKFFLEATEVKYGASQDTEGGPLTIDQLRDTAQKNLNANTERNRLDFEERRQEAVEEPERVDSLPYLDATTGHASEV